MPGGAGFAAAIDCARSTAEGSQLAASAMGDGIDGAEAVDDVVAEEERDVEATLLDGYVLQAVNFGGRR